MKVTIRRNRFVGRKLKAVMTKDGRFYLNERGGQMLLLIRGRVFDTDLTHLSDVIKYNPNATPVYEGDSVTIKF